MLLMIRNNYERNIQELKYNFNVDKVNKINHNKVFFK